MCGIVGVMSKRVSGLFNGDLDIFSDMLFADQVRGAHGTGIMYEVNGQGRAFKGAIPASIFLQDKKLDGVFTDIIQKSQFVVGHNRHATKGKLSFENTHPFMVGPITLIHNGTLPSHKYLKDVEVDSHAICHSMAEAGELETLEKIDGAFALVWFNNETKELNFIRNTERPLYIIESEYLITIASEPKLAQWVLDRRNAWKIETPKLCDSGTLYTYSIKKNKLTSRAVKIKAKQTYVGYNKSLGWDNQSAAADYYTGEINKNHHFTPGANTTPSVSTNTNVTPIVNPNKSAFIDVRLGDIVMFSPIEVMSHGKQFVMNGLADKITSSTHYFQLKSEDELFVKVYHADFDTLSRLGDHELCRGEVVQILVGKDKPFGKTVVLKNPTVVPVEVPVNQVC